MHRDTLLSVQNNWWGQCYPPCSQVGVESDSRIGADSSWLTGVLMSLTIYLSCPDLPFQNLSVTHGAKCEPLMVSSAQNWSYWYLWLNHCEENDSLERGPQTLEQSVDMAHTKGHKSPEPSDPDPVELETWRTVESGQQTRWVKPCTDNSSQDERTLERPTQSKILPTVSHLRTHALSEWASRCQPL